MIGLVEDSERKEFEIRHEVVDRQQAVLRRLFEHHVFVVQRKQRQKVNVISFFFVVDDALEVLRQLRFQKHFQRREIRCKILRFLFFEVDDQRVFVAVPHRVLKYCVLQNVDVVVQKRLVNRE